MCFPGENLCKALCPPSSVFECRRYAHHFAQLYVDTLDIFEGCARPGKTLPCTRAQPILQMNPCFLYLFHVAGLPCCCLLSFFSLSGSRCLICLSGSLFSLSLCCCCGALCVVLRVASTLLHNRNVYILVCCVLDASKKGLIYQNCVYLR